MTRNSKTLTATLGHSKLCLSALVGLLVINAAFMAPAAVSTGQVRCGDRLVQLMIHICNGCFYGLNTMQPPRFLKRWIVPPSPLVSPNSGLIAELEAPSLSPSSYLSSAEESSSSSPSSYENVIGAGSERSVLQDNGNQWALGGSGRGRSGGVTGAGQPRYRRSSTSSLSAFYRGSDHNPWHHHPSAHRFQLIGNQLDQEQPPLLSRNARQKRAGIVERCCKRSCSLSVLREYCLQGCGKNDGPNA